MKMAVTMRNIKLPFLFFNKLIILFKKILFDSLARLVESYVYRKNICAIYLYLAAFKEAFDIVTVAVLLIYLVRQVSDKP